MSGEPLPRPIRSTARPIEDLPDLIPAERGGRASALLGMLTVSGLAGVLVAIAVTPVAVVVAGHPASAEGLFALPNSDVSTTPLDRRSELFARDGSRQVRIATFFAEDRAVVPWSGITAAVRRAAIAGEDVRFYDHGALDPVAIVRATVANTSGGDLQGASTITQQYVKNVCVQEAAGRTTRAAVDDAYAACTDASLVRKVREARLALALEKRHSKDAILLGYLNIVGFGGRVYGIEAAAEHYFSTTAKALTIAQAASLIAIVNDPQALRIDVAENLEPNRVRRDHILAVELHHDLITRAQYRAAVAQPVRPSITPSESGCRPAGGAAYFCDLVVRTLLADDALGDDVAARTATLERSGLRITSTLDLAVQHAADRSMAAAVPATVAALQLGGAAVSVEVGTGRIIAMAQNTTYDASANAAPGSTSVNYSVDRALGESGGFQPGSTFKLFTLLQWLKTGHRLTDRIDSNGGVKRGYTACGAPYRGPAWTVGNDTADENGVQTVLEGTARSINGTFATMAQQLDLCDIQQTAEDLGVQPVSGVAAPRTQVPFVIGGAYSVSPLAMAGAYAGVANGGTACTPVAIDRLVAGDGHDLVVPTSSCTRAVSPAVADAAVRALHGVLTTGNASRDRTADGIFEFGKTGTTDDALQTWMIGSSSRVTTAVWVGNVSGSTTLRKTTLSGCRVYGSLASNARHCVWTGIQTAANAEYGGATAWADPAARYLAASRYFSGAPRAAPRRG